jgi:hypothetical protein
MALPASRVLVRIGPVKGVGSQAGQMIFGARWLAARGCETEWAYLGGFAFAPTRPSSNRKLNMEEWGSVTFCSGQ